MLLQSKEYRSAIAFVVETKDDNEFLILRQIICDQYRDKFIPTVYKLSYMKQIFKLADQKVPLYTTTLTANRILTGLKIPNKLITAVNMASNVQYN